MEARLTLYERLMEHRDSRKTCSFDISFHHEHLLEVPSLWVPKKQPDSLSLCCASPCGAHHAELSSKCAVASPSRDVLWEIVIPFKGISKDLKIAAMDVEGVRTSANPFWLAFNRKANCNWN